MRSPERAIRRRRGAFVWVSAAALLAASCGSSSAATSDQSSSQPLVSQTDPAPQQQPSVTVAFEAGSTVEDSTEPTAGNGSLGDGTDAGADSRNTNGSSPDAGGDPHSSDTATASTIVPAGPPAPLRGLPVVDESVLQRRAVASKVDNNNSRARPHFGLAEADIVYEVLIEGAATRFVTVHHSDMPERVGPVRSARSGDVDLLADLDAPYFVYSGANTDVLRALRGARSAGTITDLGALRTAEPYWRDPARSSPHNLFFEHQRLESPTSASVAPLFEYVPDAVDTPGVTGAAGVTVTYHAQSGNVVSHIWDAVAQGWVRIQRGELHLTHSLDSAAEVIVVREVAPANVVVLMCDYERSAADDISPHVVSYGTGQALVLTAGAVNLGVWERTADRPGFRFTDQAGNPLSLSPGSTWMLMANQSRRFPTATVETVTAAEGARMLAEARQAAQAAAADSVGDT